MEKQKLISNIIKVSIAILFAIIFIVLFSQYITMAQLKNKNSKLDAELANTKQQYDDLSQQYDDISNNYEDYVTDYVRDNYDYVEDGEILINKDWYILKLKQTLVCFFYA